MVRFSWPGRCLGVQLIELGSRSTVPPCTQDNGTPKSNGQGTEAVCPPLLFSWIIPCLGTRRKKSNSISSQPPGDRLFPDNVGTILVVYGEDVKYPRLRVRTHTGCIRDGYCSIEDLPLMPDVWLAYSQWAGRVLTPETERLIPKYPLQSGRKLIANPTSVFVEAYGGVLKRKVNGAYPVLALVKLGGNKYSESVFLSSVHVFLESEGAEKAIEPRDREVLISYWEKEIYAGVL